MEAIRDGTTPVITSLIIQGGVARGNGIVSSFVQGLQRGSLCTLVELRLSNAGLGFNEMYHLLKALVYASSTKQVQQSVGIFITPPRLRLRTLALDGNPGIGTLGLQVNYMWHSKTGLLARLLFFFFSLLTSSSSPVSVILKALSTCLRQNGLPYLTCLNMNGTKGGDEGVLDLSRVLEAGTIVSTTLKQLHLNDCDIGPHGT